MTSSCLTENSSYNSSHSTLLKQQSPQLFPSRSITQLNVVILLIEAMSKETALYQLNLSAAFDASHYNHFHSHIILALVSDNKHSSVISVRMVLAVTLYIPTLISFTILQYFYLSSSVSWVNYYY
jgi:hypothetical protein